MFICQSGMHNNVQGHQNANGVSRLTMPGVRLTSALDILQGGRLFAFHYKLSKGSRKRLYASDISLCLQSRY